MNHTLEREPITARAKFRARLLAHDTDRKVLRPLRHKLARALPHWLVTDVLIMVGNRATRGHEVVTDVTFMDIYGRWYTRDVK